MNEQAKILTLTSSAAEKIKSMMARDDKEGAGLRLGVITGGCAGLSYDMRFAKTPYDNDVIVEEGGIRIFINPESVPFLKGIQIDNIDTLKESGFKYRNPNAASSCGCGTSFS
jgi:iron-sulfur cluster assembly accessory protein